MVEVMDSAVMATRPNHFMESPPDRRTEGAMDAHAVHRPRKVHIYCNGDRFFRGKLVHLNFNRYRNFNDLLNDLTGKLSSTMHLAYGVRQIFTPVTGRKIRDISQMQDGQEYVCAGFEMFKPMNYGSEAMTESWPLGRSHVGAEPLGDTQSSPPSFNGPNAFHPQRRLRLKPTANRKYMALRPSIWGMHSSPNPFSKPKVVTVFLSGVKPHPNIKILLNHYGFQSLDQFLRDVSEAFGPKWTGSRLRKLYSIRGREVNNISDFFRDDDVFIGAGIDDPSLTEVSEILEQLYPDSPYANLLLRKWERAKKRRNRLGQASQRYEAFAEKATVNKEELNEDKSTENRPELEQIIAKDKDTENANEPSINKEKDGKSEDQTLAKGGVRGSLDGEIKIEDLGKFGKADGNATVKRVESKVRQRRKKMPEDENLGQHKSEEGQEKDKEKNREKNRDIEYKGGDTVRGSKREREREEDEGREREERKREKEKEKELDRQQLREQESHRGEKEKEKQMEREQKNRERQMELELEKERDKFSKREREKQKITELEQKEVDKEKQMALMREKEKEKELERMLEMQKRRKPQIRLKPLSDPRRYDPKERLDGEGRSNNSNREADSHFKSTSRNDLRTSKDKENLQSLMAIEPVITPGRIKNNLRNEGKEKRSDSRNENSKRLTPGEAAKEKSGKKEDTKQNNATDFRILSSHSRKNEVVKEKFRKEGNRTVNAKGKLVVSKDYEQQTDDDRSLIKVKSVEDEGEDYLSRTDTARSRSPQKKKGSKQIVFKSKLERQISNAGHVAEKYELGKVLGDGNFAVVKSCRHRLSSREYAMKVIDKSKLRGKESMIENEIILMKVCDHPNIVKLYEEYETNKEIYLVMELVKGGDLFDAITQSVKFSEVETAKMVFDLAQALYYLHSRSVVHRDLKPENILVHHGINGERSLKLADFGLAMEVHDLIYTVCGTPTYVAPEILSEIGYGLEIDMWALGVITYILLCGFPPFRSAERKQTELFEFIKAGEFEFLSPYWDSASEGSKTLINRLLVVDPKKRYSAIDVLCDPFIVRFAGSSPTPDIDIIITNLRCDLDQKARQNREQFRRQMMKKRL